MPPVLDPSQSKVDGLAFLGLSLTRKSETGHPYSRTHQTAFDLNEVLDRDYEYVFSTNDDGWLVGGGEPGPPMSYKLAAPDSAHVEIMRIGTYRPEWGGVAEKDIIDAFASGRILVPQIEVLPTAVVANGDLPPELEIRFDMTNELDKDGLPINWQLRFLHNQLFNYFNFPSRFCPGAFHSTILRKAEFRSGAHRSEYFAKCDRAIQAWSAAGPQPLVAPERDERIQVVSASEPSSQFQSGLWLFTDRNNISHTFPPNFLPPYTDDKRRLILEVLQAQWDEKNLLWKEVSLDASSVENDPPPTAVEEVKAFVASAIKTNGSDDPKLLDEHDHHHEYREGIFSSHHDNELVNQPDEEKQEHHHAGRASPPSPDKHAYHPHHPHTPPLTMDENVAVKPTDAEDIIPKEKDDQQEASDATLDVETGEDEGPTQQATAATTEVDQEANERSPSPDPVMEIIATVVTDDVVTEEEKKDEKEDDEEDDDDIIPFGANFRAEALDNMDIVVQQKTSCADCGVRDFFESFMPPSNESSLQKS